VKCSEVLQCNDGNKVSKIIGRPTDNRKLLLTCIYILLLSHSFSFFSFYCLSIYGCIPFNTVIYVSLLLGLCILIVRLPWLRFFLAFSSGIRQMPGQTSKRRGTARTLPNFLLFCLLFVLCRSAYCLCVNVCCTTAIGGQPNFI